jgi:hypothetical protein
MHTFLREALLPSSGRKEQSDTSCPVLACLYCSKSLTTCAKLYGVTFPVAAAAVHTNTQREIDICRQIAA